MPLYENAVGIYNSSISLHDGTTFSHRYKAVLTQIRGAIRQIGGAETMSVVEAWERELDRLDNARRGLENKLLVIYPGMANVLKALGEDGKSVSVVFGNYDAETDGVGTQMFSNMLELQGSEAMAVVRVKELIKKA